MPNTLLLADLSHYDNVIVKCFKSFLLSSFTLFSLLFLPSSAAADLDAGFFQDRFSLTLRPGERSEWLGPLLSFETNDLQQGFTLTPLFSWRSGTSTETAEFDLAYPILTYDASGPEYRFQFFQLFAIAGGKNQQDDEKSRFTLFPFFFWQRSENPAENYTALFPFYGGLQNRLFRDELFFILFPLYIQSEKRGVTTDNYLFPIFHKRHGYGLKGWQAWPIIGREVKEVTTITNRFGDLEKSLGHEKFFGPWPIYFNNRIGIGGTNEGTQFLILPFYASQKAPSRESTSYGWPIGLTRTLDREKGYRETGAPWPLVVFADGPGKKTRRVWPLFGKAKTPILQSDFYAWPIYKYNRATSSPLDRERTRILFFLYSDLIERNTVKNTALHRRDFWPLFTWRSEHDGNSRLQILAPLEPVLPNNKTIERTYSPLWSIWRSENNPRTGDNSHSLLWNLYRKEKHGAETKHSALFGLFRLRKNAEGTHLRIFYLGDSR
ncbi:MAG: hypothetical protein SFY81_02960 [Verrucomicrobiota bacterium]|nr:hypothetical protein [Verrucomicrobiota bacterium]